MGLEACREVTKTLRNTVKKQNIFPITFCKKVFGQNQRDHLSEMHLPAEWKPDKRRIKAGKAARLLSNLHRPEGGPRSKSRATAQSPGQSRRLKGQEIVNNKEGVTERPRLPPVAWF